MNTTDETGSPGPRPDHGGGAGEGPGEGAGEGASSQPGGKPEGQADSKAGGQGERRLTRSRDDKVLGGLCGGLGRYFAVDPVVFRIAFVVLCFVGGTGFLLYLAGWLLVPDDRGTVEADQLVRSSGRTTALWVLGLVALLLLFDGFDGWGPDRGFPLAAFLAVAGLVWLWSRRDNPPPGPGPGPGPEPPADARPTDARPSDARPTDARATEARAVGPALSGFEPGPVAAPSVASPSGASKAGPKSVLTAVTLSVLAIIAGVLALAGASVATGLAVGLVVTGLALVIGAWRGRAGGLVPVGVLLSLALFVATVVDVPLRGGVGEREYRPAVLAEVRSPYRLGVGEMTVDLGRVSFPAASQTVVASVGIGQLTVVVPAAVQVVVTATAGFGEVVVDGQRDWRRTPTERVVLAGEDGGGRLVLHARVGVGQVEVLRAGS
ncbi:MAG: PspC domain-containing protein [Actinomycetota bacterium]